MDLTHEFKQTVLQNNNLKAKIMLKDSLLVDTSFNQFDEMLRYAESQLKDFWVKDEDDDEILSNDPQEFNAILAGLVNHFSRKRVNHLKKMICTMYPQKKIKKLSVYKESAVIIKQTAEVKREYREITKNRADILKAVGKIEKNKRMDTKDVEEIKKAAMSIVAHCDRIIGK